MPDDFENTKAWRDYLGRQGACRNALALGIRLHRQFSRSRRRAVPPKLRFAVLRRDEFRCRLCGASAETGATLHVDHKHPVAKGGTSDETNLWTLCLECNLGKGVEGLA